MYPENFFNPPQSSAQWTWSDHKVFEHALVSFPEELPDRWVQVAKIVGKSVQEVEEHYKALVHDVYEIDVGRVEFPDYVDEYFESYLSEIASQILFDNGKDNGKKKKGNPWTVQEHKSFLLGLERFGKGDWKRISRNMVITRTPSQVASHAQKYFLRQNSTVENKRRRSSIHDIITVDDNLVGILADQTWIPPQSREPPEHQQTIQALVPSPHFPSEEDLIFSSQVITQTPTQVASPTQNYFFNQNSTVNKERMPSSIHDITTVDNNLLSIPVDQSWILPQPAEPLEHQLAMQALVPSSQFQNEEDLFCQLRWITKDKAD